MALKNVRIELTLDNQYIEGTFRGMVAASNVDILLLGNKKSSLLLSFNDVSVKKIIFVHTDQAASFGNGYKAIATHFLNKEKIITEIYEPQSRQQAFSILISIYSKYKGSKPTIDTEGFDNVVGELQYSIKSGDISYSTNNYEPITHIEAEQPKEQYIESKPKITKIGISEFMNKVLKGYKHKRTYLEQGYSGQLNN